MAGNGTIGLELDEDAPEFDSVSTRGAAAG